LAVLCGLEKAYAEVANRPGKGVVDLDADRLSFRHGTLSENCAPQNVSLRPHAPRSNCLRRGPRSMPTRKSWPRYPAHSCARRLASCRRCTTPTISGHGSKCCATTIGPSSAPTVNRWPARARGAAVPVAYATEISEASVSAANGINRCVSRDRIAVLLWLSHRAFEMWQPPQPCRPRVVLSSLPCARPSRSGIMRVRDCYKAAESSPPRRSIIASY
jgi:hypothetical protein